MIKQEDVAQPCLNCSNNKATLGMRRELVVGFGCCSVVLDSNTVYYEPHYEDEDYQSKVWVTYDAEFRARQSNAVDARIIFDGPLWGGTYQRQGENNWVLIEQNEGFA